VFRGKIYEWRDRQKKRADKAMDVWLGLSSGKLCESLNQPNIFSWGSSNSNLILKRAFPNIMSRIGISEIMTTDLTAAQKMFSTHKIS
jgi:hypothetical protein